MRLTAKNYNRLVPRLVARMKADLEHADDALFAGLSGGEGDISRWPGDGEFRDFLTSRDVYGSVSQPRLVMALAAVEAALYSSKTDIPQLAENLSLEHLLPQGWEENWPLRDVAGKPLQGEKLALATEERSMRIHRLGNLTLVTQPLNASLSNSAWSIKRKELNAHSKLLLNARLAEREAWDEEAIDEHGAWLAGQLVSIWPGPTFGSWTTSPEPTSTWPGPASEKRTTMPVAVTRDYGQNVVDGQQLESAGPVPTKPSVERWSIIGSNAATATCRYCGVEQPVDTEHWFRHKASGQFHVRSRCKSCEKEYRSAKRRDEFTPAKLRQNPYPHDGLRFCTYPGHEGDNPLPADEDHFPVRKSGPREGTFVGWCRACRKLYAQSRG